LVLGLSLARWCFLDKKEPCMHVDGVYCPYPEIAKSRRFSSVCVSCKHFKLFIKLMDIEDERIMDEIDDIHRNPKKYGYGSAP
jgi:hypothetical protein